MTPDEQDLDIDFVDAPPAGGAPPPKGPSRGRKILSGVLGGGRMLLGLVAGALAFVLTLGVMGARKIGAGIQKLKNREKKPKPIARKHMGLRHAFYGALILGGALVGPGAYYMTQPNEIVTTRVTGKVEADTDKEYPGRQYIIHTKGEGRLDTRGVPGGSEIRPGCTYEFNLKGARLEYWPPGYTRSVQSFKHYPTPGCLGGQ